MLRTSEPLESDLAAVIGLQWHIGFVAAHFLNYVSKLHVLVDFVVGCACDQLTIVVNDLSCKYQCKCRKVKSHELSQLFVDVLLLHGDFFLLLPFEIHITIH